MRSSRHAPDLQAGSAAFGPSRSMADRPFFPTAKSRRVSKLAGTGIGDHHRRPSSATVIGHYHRHGRHFQENGSKLTPPLALLTFISAFMRQAANACSVAGIVMSKFSSNLSRTRFLMGFIHESGVME